MKKLLRLLTIVTLTSTSVPNNVTTVINNNLSQRLNNVQNSWLNNYYKLTGFIGKPFNLKFDNKNNLYFIAKDNKVKNKDCLYKVFFGTTNAVEITGYKNIISTIEYFEFDKNDNLIIQTLNSIQNKREFYKLESDKTEVKEITGFKNDGDLIRNIIFSNNNSFCFVSKENFKGKSKLYKVCHGTTNAVEITGYESEPDNLLFDSENNLYFRSNDRLYKLSNNSTSATKIDGYDQPDDFITDNNGVVYFCSIKNGIEKFYKIDKNSIIPTEITGYLGIFWYRFLDKNNNLYLLTKYDDYGEQIVNLYKIENGTNIVKIISNYKSTQDRIGYIIFDNKNNLYIVGKNIDDTLNIYKIENNSFKAKEIMKNQNFKSVKLNLDNKNNLYIVDKNIDDTLNIYKVNNDSNQPTEFIKSKILNDTEFSTINFIIDDEKNTFIFISQSNNKIINFIFKIDKDNNLKKITNFGEIYDGIFALNDNKLVLDLSTEKGLLSFNQKYNPNPAPTPSKLMPAGEIIVIVASSLIGLGILGFGSYFIYYDRKHHVVKKWWEKRKGGK